MDKTGRTPIYHPSHNIPSSHSMFSHSRSDDGRACIGGQIQEGSYQMGSFQKMYKICRLYPINCWILDSTIKDTGLENSVPERTIVKIKWWKIRFNIGFSRLNINMRKQVLRKVFTTCFQSLRLISGVREVFQHPLLVSKVQSECWESVATPTSQTLKLL